MFIKAHKLAMALMVATMAISQASPQGGAEGGKLIDKAGSYRILGNVEDAQFGTLRDLRVINAEGREVFSVSRTGWVVSYLKGTSETSDDGTLWFGYNLAQDGDGDWPLCLVRIAPGQKPAVITATITFDGDTHVDADNIAIPAGVNPKEVAPHMAKVIAAFEKKH